MTVVVKHYKVCGGENDPTKEVSKDAWNADHTLEGLGSAAEADVGDFATALHNHNAAYDAIGSADAALTAALAADFSGAYGDLTGTPTLGDAAAKNTGTGAGDVAAGDHTHAGGGSALDAWPVGSVYIAVDSTSPATRFGGGSWSAFGAGRVLVGLDSGDTDFDVAEETGGAKTVTLSAAQSGLPQHTHTQDVHTHTQNAHTHVQDAHTHNFLPRSSTTGAVSSIVTGTLDTSSAISGANQPHIQTATAVNQNATAVNQNATAVNQNAGPTAASAAHSNVQPYIVVYMWKRTA